MTGRSTSDSILYLVANSNCQSSYYPPSNALHVLGYGYISQKWFLVAGWRLLVPFGKLLMLWPVAQGIYPKDISFLSEVPSAQQFTHASREYTVLSRPTNPARYQPTILHASPAQYGSKRRLYSSHCGWITWTSISIEFAAKTLNKHARVLYHSNILLPAKKLSQYDWVVYPFNSGHFLSTIRSRGLPFKVVLACDPHSCERTLFHDMSDCAKVLPSAKSMLDHIWSSGIQSNINAYIIHSCWTGVNVGHLPCATTLHVLRRSICGAKDEIISTMMLIEDVLSDAMAVKKPPSTILAERVLITLITGFHHRS